MTEHIVDAVQLREAGSWDVHGNASRIEMRCDGAGPMGWYDVIYVYDYNGVELAAMPAHLVEQWVKL